MAKYNAFATHVVNVSFPDWFYAAHGVGALMPLTKAALTAEQRAAGVSPDVRPIAVGEVDARAFGTCLADSVKADAEATLYPQLAVGVKGGAELLVHGIKFTLEHRSDFVCVKLDMPNGS